MNKSEIDEANYIANYLNIVVDDNAIIAKEIAEIQNKPKFIAYMQKHIGDNSIKFLPSSLAKLSELKRAYEEERQRKIKRNIYDFVEKIGKIWELIQRENLKDYKLEKFHTPDNKPLFNKYQTKILNGLGGLDSCLRLYEHFALNEAVDNLVYRNIRPNTLIEYTNKRKHSKPLSPNEAIKRLEDIGKMLKNSVKRF